VQAQVHADTQVRTQKIYYYKMNLPAYDKNFPNKNKQTEGCVFIGLINTKFKNYNDDYKHRGQSIFSYLMNMWLNLPNDCDYWEFIFQHYKYHKRGNKEYHIAEGKKSSMVFQAWKLCKTKGV